MPTYEYQCKKCGREFEYQQRMSDPEKTLCEACGAEALERMISRTAFSLKGGGWYKDLYASSKPEKPADAGSGTTANTDAPAAASGDAAKPAAPAAASGTSGSGTSGSGTSGSGTSGSGTSGSGTSGSGTSGSGTSGGGTSGSGGAAPASGGGGAAPAGGSKPSGGTSASSS
ncbi:MAG TPA: zinc ribbon domain-containing protein [Kofleriaceae bacterium]